jgi:flagellar biosynthesis protein
MSKQPSLAVALQYDRANAPTPRIIALARAHGVPIEENALLAQALSQVEVGDDIPEALYRAVAEVLIFILRASGRIK